MKMNLHLELFFFFKDFIYLFDSERQPAREGTQAGGVGEEEAGSQRRIPITLGSCPEPKADA